MKCEASIIVAIRYGEKELFHGLILPYEEAAYRLAFCVLRDSADAEDVVQEACLSAYRNLHSFRVESSFGTWLLSIVLNEARFRLQEKKQSSPSLVGEEQWPDIPSLGRNQKPRT
jgi:RNA polymerase sigma-70 factor (ECF subfamily)